MQPSARQWDRIDYQAPLQLVLEVGLADRRRTLHALAVNVSQGGMQVRTDDALPVGEPVTCSMLLEGRPAALPGRVRWTRSTAPGFAQPGAGIQFDQLSELDSGLLRHLVARGARGDQPVEIFFANMSEPVHARAFVRDGGLYISAALPVLSREAPLEFQIGGEGPRFHGRIAGVQVRERGRTPHLEVELAVDTQQAPRFRHYTMYGDAEKTAVAWGAPSGAASADRIRQHTLPAWQPRPEGDPVEAYAERGRVAAPAASIPTSRAARLPRPLLALLISLGAVCTCGLLAWIVVAPGAPRRELEREPHIVMPLPLATSAAVRPEPNARVHGLPEAKPAALAALAAPATPSLAAPIETPVPTLSVGAQATEVIVPITGSLEGMHSTRWASPLAVIVDLPNAKLALPTATYTLHTGHVSRLTLGHDEGITRIRVFLDGPTLGYTVRLRNGSLVVRIEHGLRAPAPIPGQRS
jgi:Tfp pilus assembly protein PilZ